MTVSLRALLAALLAAWLVMPGIGSDTEGGENAGGTGIWILPAAAALPGALVGDHDEVLARASKRLQAVSAGVVLTMPTQLDSAVAVLVSDVSGEVIPLEVSGCSIYVPQGILDALAATRTSAKVLVTDIHQLGYVVVIEADRQGSSSFTKVDLKVF